MAEYEYLKTASEQELVTIQAQLIELERREQALLDDKATLTKQIGGQQAEILKLQKQIRIKLQQAFPPLKSSREPVRLDLATVATVTAEHTVKSGGGTGGEFPKNLVSSGTEIWNKWYEDKSSESWVEVQLPTEVQVLGFGFKSANDFPHRDPDQVDIYADDIFVGRHALDF